MIQLRLAHYTNSEKELLKNILKEGLMAEIPNCSGNCESCKRRKVCIDITCAIRFLETHLPSDEQ